MPGRSAPRPRTEPDAAPQPAPQGFQHDFNSVDDGLGFRPHAAPQEERFRRLLDQHAEAVGQLCCAVGLARTAGRASAPCRTSCRRPGCRVKTRPSAGEAVHRDRLLEVALMTRSKWQPARLCIIAAGNVAVSGRNSCASSCALSGVRLAMANSCRILFQQRQDHAARRAACTHQQNALALRC